MKVEIDEKMIDDFVERLTDKAYKNFLEFIKTNEFANNIPYFKDFLDNTYNVDSILNDTRKLITERERENMIAEANDSINFYIKRKS
jgi:hypothetical protein